MTARCLLSFACVGAEASDKFFKLSLFFELFFALKLRLFGDKIGRDKPVVVITAKFAHSPKINVEDVRADAV